MQIASFILKERIKYAKLRLLNYNIGDIVATGLYHPKTTAILFDKIWIPSDFRHSQYGHVWKV